MKIRNLLGILGTFVLALCVNSSAAQPAIHLTDQQVEDLVRGSYQYVAMYNVNNKFAITQGGWNTVEADTRLKDHTMREITRPNNYSLYIGCMLDLRKDPVIIDMPAFDQEVDSTQAGLRRVTDSAVSRSAPKLNLRNS